MVEGEASGFSERNFFVASTERSEYEEKTEGGGGVRKTREMPRAFHRVNCSLIATSSST
jgi:hypothetical protein